MGAKGVGEIGIVGAAAAVVNAVYDATGVRVRDLPVTVEKLLGEPTDDSWDLPPSALTWRTER